MTALQGQIGPENGVGVRFGVSFGSQQTSTTVGRRIAVREFANRDKPASQDLGRKARRFRINAVLLGDEYLNLYNDLVDELERPGRKRLRHPLHGDQIVRVPEQELTVSMTTDGRVDVSFDLVEAGPKDPILFVPIDLSSPIAAARAARDADAKSRMNLLSKIGQFAATALAKLRSANSALRGVKHAINARLIVIDDLAHEIDNLDDSLQDLASTPGQIANAFGNLTKQVFDLARTVTDLTVSPALAAFGAAEEMVAFGNPDPDALANAAQPNQTPERAEFADTLEAIFDMTRASAVIELTGLLPDLAFDSAQEVRDLRERLSLMVDATIGSDSMTPDLSASMGQLWASAEGFMSKRGQELPKVTTWKVPQTMPVLLIAHELYGDPDMADDIISRNRNIISNPSFVPGGTTLEVIGV